MNIIERTAFKVDESLVTEFFFTRDWTKLAKKIEKGVDSQDEAVALATEVQFFYNDFVSYLNARIIPTIKNLYSIANSEQLPEEYRRQCAETAEEMTKFSKRVMVDATKSVSMVLQEIKRYPFAAMTLFPLVNRMLEDNDQLIENALGLFEPRELEGIDFERDRIIIENFNKVVKNNLSNVKKGMLAIETLAEERKPEIKSVVESAKGMGKGPETKKM